MEFRELMDNRENSKKIQSELQKLKSIDIGEIFNKLKEDTTKIFGSKYVLYKKDEITIINSKNNNPIEKIKEFIMDYSNKYHIRYIAAFKIIEKDNLIIIKRKR